MITIPLDGLSVLSNSTFDYTVSVDIKWPIYVKHDERVYSKTGKEGLGVKGDRVGHPCAEYGDDRCAMVWLYCDGTIVPE